jgi:HTH-type transcriptional regulator/antitoxin HigA
MAVKTSAKKVTDTYFKLVHEHPLTPIRNSAELAAAQNRIDELLQQDLDSGARDYLTVLTALVEDYEDDNVKIPDASGADVLRELLRVNDLSQAQLAKEVGITQSTLSELVNGRRQFTTDHMVALGKFFGVSPAVFLPK